MKIILLLLLFLLTFMPLLYAMDMLNCWTPADYEKHLEFITAYITLSFKVEQNQEQCFITSTTSYCNQNNPVVHKWSLAQAQKALTTITSNTQAGLPTILKNDIIQSKQKEYFPSQKLNDKMISKVEIYNLCCAFFQWQSKQDEKNYSQNNDAYNRMILNKALCTYDIDQLKKLEPEKIDNYALDTSFRRLLQDYVRQETDTISAAAHAQPQQSNWFKRALNHFIIP